MCTPNGARLAFLEELLHRQVHPNFFIQDGRPSSQAFRATKSHEGCLSVARGSMVSAQQAYEAHLKRGASSVGVWSVTVEECEKEELVAFADPIDGPPPDPTHAVIEFGTLPNKKIENKSLYLLRCAIVRGCQYKP